MNSLFTLGLMIGIQVNDMTVGTTIANLGMTDVKFPHPLFENDTVHCTTEVLAKRESKSRPGAGIVEFHHRAYNQNDKLVAECKRQAFMLHAAEVGDDALPPLRSRRQRQEARQGRRMRRRRADPRPGGLRRGRTQGGRARDRARLSASSMPGTRRQQLVVRVNALDTGLTDADLDAVVAGRPDAILLPKAEGGAAVIHLDAKLTAREAIHGLPDGAIKILALATETAASLFLCGTYRDASPRLTAITWGAEDLSAELGSETNRDAAGRFTSPYMLARNLSLAAAASARVQAIDTVYADFRNMEGCGEAEEALRDGFTAKMAIHPAQVAPINAVFTPSAEAIATAQAVVDGVRGQSLGRRGRHRRRDVRPPASDARGAATRARQADVATISRASRTLRRCFSRPTNALAASVWNNSCVSASSSLTGVIARSV